MTSHSNFIFQERRELWDDVLKITNAERNGAYDLRRIEVHEDIILLDPITLKLLDRKPIASKKSQHFVEKRVIKWIFPDKQTVRFNDILPFLDKGVHDKQDFDVEKILYTIYRPHELLVYTKSYDKSIFYRTDKQVNKNHPVFTKLNKYLKHINDIQLLKDERGNCLNPDNKSLLESSITFLKTYQENIIKASHNKDNDVINYLLSPKVLLISETGDVFQISRDIALRLLSVKDIFRTSSRKEDQTGLSSVHNEGNVHFKSISNSKNEPRPGNEFISYALSKALTNEPLITPSILMKLVDVPQVETLPSEAVIAQVEGKSIDKALAELELDVELELVNCFIQASRSVGDQDFNKYLKSKEGKMDGLDDTTSNNSILDTFDKENLSWHFILSLFLQPGDGKADNYAIQVKNGKNIIIGIDNDKVFYPNIYVSEDTHYVSVQCIFYAWKEFMELNIDEKVRDKVLRTSPSTFLLNWTSILELQNNVYENLMDKGYLNSDEVNELQLPLMFTEDIVSKVFDLWEMIQTNLSSRTKSHNGILKHIDPLISSWYKTLRERYTSILEAGYIAYKGFDKNDNTIYLKDILETDLKEQLKRIDNTNRTPIQSISIQHFYESMMEIFKENRYIENFWHELESIDVHDDIYNRIYIYNPNAVDLIDSKGKYPLDYALEAYIERNHEKPFIRLVSLNAKQMNSNYMPMHFKMEKMIEKDPSFNNSEVYTSFLTWIHRYGGKGLWEISITQMFPKYTGEGNYITGSHCGKRYLRWEIKEQLNNDNNNVKYGRRKVKQIHYKGFKVYVKYYPGLPGYEEAVGILCREIIGWGTPYGELFKLEDGTPVWISLSIKGEVLQDVMTPKSIKYNYFYEFLLDNKFMDPESIKFNNTYESQLDNKYMSDIILMSMLINPEDGKPDNYLLEHINNTYRLVCVDNDQCFAPAYVQKRPENSFLGQVKPVCQVKSILYCFPHMNEPIHDETKQKFISLQIEELLKHWLEQLNEVNENYIKLFNNDEMKQLVDLKEDICFTRVGFQGVYIEHIYTKMYRLQDWLRKKKNATITHIELLMKLEPYLASRYKKVLNNTSLSVWDRFECVDRGFYGNKTQSIVPSRLVLESTINLPIGKTLLECIQNEEELGPKEALIVLNKIIEQKKDENLTFEQIVSNTQLEYKLKNFDFNEYDYKHSEKLNLVKQLSNRELKYMTIRNCEALNDDLITTFMLKQLRKVQWINVDISIKTLRVLTSTAMYLETLYLYKCNKLEKLSISPLLFGADKMIHFKSLKTLKIRQCSNIEYILLDGPNISTLEIKDCELLTRFEIKGPKLKEIQVENTENLESFVLSEAPLSSHELYNLTRCIRSSDIKFDKCSGSRHENFGNIIKDMKDHTYNDYIRVLDNDPTITMFKCNNLFGNDIVKQIQNNTSLLELTLSYCHLNDSSLEMISNIFNLKTLDLSWNNIGDIGCFYLSNNTTLTTLDLSYNKIGPNGCFHLSKISTLTTLNLSSSKIGDIGCEHLSKNTTLTTLYLNTNYIGDEGYSYLSKSTTLTTLNLSVNNIGDIECFHLSKNTTLTTLDLSYNRIGPHGCSHLSKISTLTTLNLSYNRIGPHGCSHLSKISTLTTLYLSCNRIGPHGCEHLSKNTTLTTLYLSKNNIGDKGCEYLSNNTTLTTLYLSYNKIGPKGCEYLSNNTTLTTLYLSSINIGDKGCEYLSNNTTLTTLDLSNTNIGDKGCEYLSDNTTLTTLNLSYNRIGPHGCEHLSKNTTLTTLNLSYIRIGPHGCEYLSKNTTLTTLYLSENKIGPNGCEYLSKNTTLITLDMSKNSIEDKGCFYLSNNTTLTTLDLTWNNIGDNGCEYLSNNTTLTTLNLSYIRIGPNGCSHLSKNTTLTTLILIKNYVGDIGCEYLSKSTTLTTLNLRSNNIGDIGCEYLSKNTTLTTLYLSYNNIGDKGCEYLSKNTTLTTLDLSYNRIGPHGCEYLSKNTTLTTLYLSENKIGPNGCEYLSKNTTLITLNL